MAKICINGTELDFSVYDAQTFEQYEKACMLVRDESKRSLEEQGGKGFSEAIRIQCQAVKKGFDMIFGKGTGVAILGERDDLMVCQNAFMALVMSEQEQAEEMQQAEQQMRKLLGVKDVTSRDDETAS